jgi:hypothetical protein
MSHTAACGLASRGVDSVAAGPKESRLGREGSPHGIDEFVELKIV